jgi:hypothetical protein
LVTDAEFGQNILLEELKYITKTNVFCNVRQYSLVEIYCRFVGTYCLCLQEKASPLTDFVTAALPDRT